MYSKEKGITYGRPLAAERAFGGTSPFGEPAYRTSRPVRVPANYSGHAIVDGEERPLGSLSPVYGGGEAELHRSPVPSPEPHFEGLPRVSELGDRRLPPPRVFSTEANDDSSADGEAQSASAGADALSPPPSPPPISVFGHSIGTEELLLLGLILFLLLEGSEGEDKGDLTETVVLLGLLLVLGW